MTNCFSFCYFCQWSFKCLNRTFSSTVGWRVVWVLWLNALFHLIYRKYWTFDTCKWRSIITDYKIWYSMDRETTSQTIDFCRRTYNSLWNLYQSISNRNHKWLKTFFPRRDQQNQYEFLPRVLLFFLMDVLVL